MTQTVNESENKRTEDLTLCKIYHANIGG